MSNIVSTYLLEDKLRTAEAMGVISSELVKDLLISVAKLRSQISILSEKYGESEAINAKLRECVEFYANPDTWQCGLFERGSEKDLLTIAYDSESEGQVCGKKARETLKELEGGEATKEI